MKTLDEVINALEDEGLFPDALYYLKMYRSDMQMYAENQKYWEDELKQKIKDFGDAKERYIARLKELEIGTLNDPLSWEQLKTMEGKPVWVETKTKGGRWMIFERIGSVYGLGDVAVFSCDVGITCYKKNCGKTWNAYRKERE